MDISLSSHESEYLAFKWLRDNKILLRRYVKTTVTCNECGNELKQKFQTHWSCDTCKAWVMDVTKTEEEYSPNPVRVDGV